MTMALTRFEAYGVQIDEPVTRLFKQYAVFEITGANTDVDYDFGDYAGTFWTAVGATSPGTTALLAVKDIALRAKDYLRMGGLGLTGKTLISSSTIENAVYTSGAGSGGGATETLTITGLAAADTILAASQVTSGSNHTAFVEWTDTSRTVDQLDCRWTGDPGAGATVRVYVQKAAATTPAVLAGQYSVTLDGTNATLPNLLFATTNAPTSMKITLEWELLPNVDCVKVIAP